MGTRTFLRQDTQLRNSDLYDDLIAAGSSMESAPANLQDDLNNVRSQLRRLFFADAAGDWFSDVPTVNAKKRGLSQLGTDLDDIEEKKLLFRAQVLADVSVGAGNNFVVLSAAGGETPTEVAAVTALQNGAVVAVLGAGQLGTHQLAEVGGFNALGPKNLVIVRDASTGDDILSNGKRVLGLLQAEDGVLDGEAFNDVDKRIQLSFVRENATGDDLEAVPAADIGGRVVNYAYVRRINLDALPEQSFVVGAFVDAGASVNVTLDASVDAQSGPVTQDQDIAWRITDGFSLKWQTSDGLRDLLAILPAAAGDEVELNLDTLDVNLVNPADFSKGLIADSAGTPIQIGVSPGLIESAAALAVADGNKAGSTFAGAFNLSAAAQDWSDFETAFGEVSLLRAIVKAKSDVQHDKAVAAVSAATIPADTNVTGAGATPNLDAQLLDYTGKDFVSEVNVYLNGTLLRSGPDALADHDVYPGDNPATGDLKFEFTLRGGAKPDVITMEVF